MFVCKSCGNKKLMESPTKYGLCQACNERLRNEVLTQLGTIKGIVEQLKTIPDDPAGCKAALQKAEEGLKAVENLENARGKYPFFKSSTEEYVVQLEAGRDAIKEKLKGFDLPEASEPTAAVEPPHETQALDGIDVEPANSESPVTSQPRPPVKAKEPFYKNSLFIAIVITIIVVPTYVFYLFSHRGLGITMDEFQETFNSTMTSLESEIQIVSIDWEEGDAAATGKISENLSFVFFLKDTDTKEIKSLLFLGSGDGTARSGADLLLCLASTIVSADPSIELDKTGPMLEEMSNNEPDHTVTKNGITYTYTQNSEIGASLHIFKD